MLSEEHARHFLSDSQREAFERDGFIVLGGVLEPHEVAEYAQLVDTIYEEQMTAEVDPYTTGLFGSDQPFFYPNILCRDQRFVGLLDHPRVFPKVLSILGWNIYAYHSHLIVTPPGFTAPYGFHEDSGRVSFDMGVRPAPRLTVKAVYWLSDLSQPGRGNLHVVPGSHLRDSTDIPEPGVRATDAVEVCANAGDVLLFDRRIWHSTSSNSSDITRKGMFYAYGFRWLRPKDEMTITAQMMAQNDPIRRQLMGGSRSNHHRYSPGPEDTPVKNWLEQYSF